MRWELGSVQIAPSITRCDVALTPAQSASNAPANKFEKVLYPFWPEPMLHGQLQDFRSMLDIVIAIRSGPLNVTNSAEIYFDEDGTTLVLGSAGPIEHHTEAAE